MAKAKTASKNNPVARAKAKDILYKGLAVIPVRLVSLKGSFIAAQYKESGKLALDALNQPIAWSKVRT